MKIAFIVQPDWLQEHFGVRNLFVSCYKILEKQGHDVDFVTFEQYFRKVLFYKELVEDEDLKSNVKQTTIGTKVRYRKLTKKKKVSFSTYRQFLGNDISDDYDAFVFTNPWLITYPLDFKNKPKILICHDCGANTLYLQSKFHDSAWGYLHNTGYKYALENNVHFLSNSEKTDREIVDFYCPANHSFLPPVPTYAFIDTVYGDNQIKENAIVLAAPFDPRKGLKIMPEVLNQLKNDFDTLYIYGTPRCGRKLYNKFYKELQFENIIHYDNITSDDLVALYKKCKLLFFPSIEEGLGMPIIEAQLCGCRVVTTDKKPMNELLCDGNYLLKNNLDDIINIRKMLHDDFDYKKLSIEAKERFSTQRIYDEFMKIIK